MAVLDTTVRVARLVQGFAEATERWFGRVERAADNAAASRYSPTDWTSDVVSSWADMMSVWYLPYQICDERMRVVVFEIDQTTDEQIETIPIPDPGVANLAVDSFVDGGGNVIIPQANAQAYPADNGHTLVVRLFGLQALAHPLAVGTYDSPVHPAGQATQLALARVIIK